MHSAARLLSANRPGPANGGSFARGRVTAVEKTRTGNALAGTYTVSLLGGGFSGGGAQLVGVPLVTPAFGSLDLRDRAPTGFVHLPSVGAHVLLAFDSTRWVILGFYTGPVDTQNETGSDRDLLSYNPGLEQPLSRRASAIESDSLPEWAFDLAPGDVLLGRDRIRVKLTAAGLILGTSPDNLLLLKTDGELLQRFLREEQRSVGYWRRHTFFGGTAQRQSTVNVDLADMAAAPEAYVYRAEVIETSPYLREQRPFSIHQRGHVHRSALRKGRASIYAESSSLANTAENATGAYCVIRDAVLQPLIPGVLPGVTDENDSVAAALYDYQVDADGSIRLRAGNTAVAPGTQLPEQDSLDFAFEFNAKTLEFSLRVGLGGVEAATVKVGGRSASDSRIEATASRIEAHALRDIIATAVGKITAEASHVELRAARVTLSAGEIELNGDVRVTGNLVTTGLVISGITSLPTHTHVSGGAGNPTSPPI